MIKRDPAWVASSNLLDGFAGKMGALRRAYDDTNSTWPTDDLVVAMQTGNHISYHPENARAEMLNLPSLVTHAMTALDGIQISESRPATSQGLSYVETQEIEIARRSALANAIGASQNRDPEGAPG